MLKWHYTLDNDVIIPDTTNVKTWDDLTSLIKERIDVLDISLEELTDDKNTLYHFLTSGPMQISINWLIDLFDNLMLNVHDGLSMYMRAKGLL